MIELIIYALAVFGASILITTYAGPWGVLAKLRVRFQNSPLECPVCTSLWAGLILFPVFILGFGCYLTPLAAVGVVILLERI